MHKVMITGAAGLIGGLLTAHLEERYSVVGVDRARGRRRATHRVNMARRKRVDTLFDGVDTVIDLAAIADTSDWNDVWKNNLSATMNTLEAARRAGARRYVFASSNHVTGMYERDAPYAAVVAGRYEELSPETIPLIQPSWPIRPDGPYALCKAFGEAAARYYSEAFGLSAVCLRIGSVNAEDRPLAPRHFATLLTHADLVRLVDAAIAAPAELRYGVYYGVSDNTWRFWDLHNARNEIGYEPQDDAEALRQTAA